MHTVTPVSPRQFAIFRFIFGTYLAMHFGALVPYGTELFSNRGVISRPQLNFTFGVFPNFLDHYDSPRMIAGLLIALTSLSVAFAFGIFRRSAAILLWYGWACLFNRNNLICNPSIPYIGLVLLLTTLVPLGEGLAPRGKDRPWKFPPMVFWAAWILLATGYSFSGLMKLRSPSWQDGSALYYVLNNPLARSNWVRHFLLELPSGYLQLLTWSSLTVELLCLPLTFTPVTRKLAWIALVGMNVGILCVINFADLTAGMLMIHLFTFDRRWLDGWFPRLQTIS